MNKLLLTPKEAAEMLSVSRAKLYELLAAGKIDSVRIDGCRRVRVEALCHYVDGLVNATAETEGFAGLIGSRARRRLVLGETPAAGEGT